MKDNIVVDVQIKSKVWQNVFQIKNFVNKICKDLILETELKDFLKKKNHQVEVLISLVSDDQIKKTNRDFRNKNKVTDVLSFSFLDEKLVRKNGLKNVIKDQEYLVLGDIVLSLEFTRKESLRSGKNFRDHLAHLILHSILHLIGYDHENKKEAQIMEDLEVKILKKFKIENPYK